MKESQGSTIGETNTVSATSKAQEKMAKEELLKHFTNVF